MKYSIAQKSYIGGRNYNEDRCGIFTREEYLLLIVADGLGGHAGGALASQTLVESIKDMFFRASEEELEDTNRFLSLCINYAHHSIHKKSASSEFNTYSPKTTCVLALIKDGVLVSAHSGDSRLYIIEKNKIVYQTEDHVEKTNKSDSPISRCVGGKEPPNPEISEAQTLKENQAILLASDGAWQSLKPIDLYHFINPEFPELGLDNLLLDLESRNKPPSDNLSMVIMYYGVQQQSVPNISSSVEQSAEHDFNPKQAKDDFLDNLEVKPIDIQSVQDTIADAKEFLKD